MTEKITSFESGGTGPFGDVFTRPAEKCRIKVGMLGLGYFEYWRMYPALKEQVRNDLAGVAERLRSVLQESELVYPGMVDTLDRAEEAGKQFRSTAVDVLVVVAGTYLPDFITLHAIQSCPSNPEVILFDTQTGNDVNPKDNYMATMRNSAMIAITQLSGSFRKMKLEYETVVGEITDPDSYKTIAGKVNSMRAVRRLRTSTYGIVGHVFRGMYDLEFDRSKVKGFLGPEVMTLQAEHLIDCWKEVPDVEVHEEAARLTARFRSKKVESDDVERSCRVGLAMRKLYRKYNLDGLCFLGQHYIEKMTTAPARMGASLLMEQDRFMVACEGDVGGLVMMDLMHTFTGRIPFQAEWGQFDLKNNALFLLGHGIGVPAHAASDSTVTLTCSPEEWGFKGSGLNYELILKPGEVTLGHFLNRGNSWQMLVSHGESIEFPALPCDELHAMVRVEKNVKEYIRELIDLGSAHHIIAVHGDAIAALRKTAEYMRIQCVEI